MQTLIYDIEADGLLDTITKIHCVVMKVHGQKRWVIYVDKAAIPEAEAWVAQNSKTAAWEVHPFAELFHLECTKLVAHNQIGFDLHALERILQVAFWEDHQIVDTLVMSRYLNPDRPYGHSLADWGTRVGVKKLQVDDWQNEDLATYITRCAKDVWINELVYDQLRPRLKDRTLWPGLKLAAITYESMVQQELDGVRFNKAAAQDLVDKIAKEMAEIAEKVEPRFGEAPLPKNEQPTWPKKPFKKNGELSATAMKYGAKLGYTDPGAVLHIIQAGKPAVLMRPIRLENLGLVKEYLYRELGWKPTLWRTKDITLDGKKKRIGPEIRKQAVMYTEKLWSSPYRDTIWDKLKIPKAVRREWDDMPQRDKEIAIYRILRQPKRLPMSPMYCTQVSKTLCPNLEKLQGDTAEQIKQWMSLRNRHGVTSGWLENPRLARDGRLSAGSSGITNTHRQKHHTVVNVPKASKKVVYGIEMRSLFIPPNGYFCVGCDASGLENRVAGHFTTPYDDGEYARILLEGDTHTVNAAAYSEVIGREVTRDDSKGITYGTLYGAGGQKIATMLNVGFKMGQQVVDAFWDANPGLKAYKEDLEHEWDKTGQKYIRGLDGRFIPTRSRHSLVNASFQSAGAIIMDRAWALARLNLDYFDCQRWGFYHDEYQMYASPGEAKAVGQILADAIVGAGQFYDMNVPLAAEFMIGSNWAEVH